MRHLTSTTVMLFSLLSCGLLNAQKTQQELPTAKAEANVTADMKPLFDTFRQTLKKSALVGTFTIDHDKKQANRAERYEISKVVKQEQGDYWIFFARIEYGSHDVTLPIPVEVKWAGNTPVITVDNLSIPGMGTFDARVVISDNKYAGTWRHGEVGGLMYGHIEKQKPTTAALQQSD